jgi:hypothetical protein
MFTRINIDFNSVEICSSTCTIKLVDRVASLVQSLADAPLLVGHFQ